MNRPSLSTVFAIVLGLTPAVPVSAGQSQTPAFRSAVDLVPVDVSVIAGDGKPVPGLTATDFSLSVDGRQRRVASAEFVSAVRGSAAPASPRVPYSTNADSGGRLIMFMVDQGTIGPGRGRSVMESAVRFVSQLSPADKLALLTVPSATTQ